MRAADTITLLRVALVFVIGYLIITRFGALLIVLLIVLMFVMDNLDGYLATSVKPSAPDFISYIKHEVRGKERSGEKSSKKPPKHGAYLDIAADRITEYTLWIIFTYLNLLPLFVVLVIVVRNSLADAFTASKGKTFAEMKTAFGRVASSHLSRGLYGTLKAVDFIYLSLVFVSGWPLWIGYLLTAVVVVYSVFRGSAEVYEALL